MKLYRLFCVHFIFYRNYNIYICFNASSIFCKVTRNSNFIFLSNNWYGNFTLYKAKISKTWRKKTISFAEEFNSAKDLLNSIKEIKMLGVENFYK